MSIYYRQRNQRHRGFAFHFHKPRRDICANSIFITAVLRIRSSEERGKIGYGLKRHEAWVGYCDRREQKVMVHQARSRRRRARVTVVNPQQPVAERGNGECAPRIYCSPAPKSFSFSCWAFSKASLKRLASRNEVSQASDIFHQAISLTFAVGKADSQGLSLGLTLADIGGGVPHPAAVTTHVGAQLHIGDNCIIRQLSYASPKLHGQNLL